ncbi:MAG: DUF2147 domain-containing protein [Gammaproteobacteria bacterium]
MFKKILIFSAPALLVSSVALAQAPASTSMVASQAKAGPDAAVLGVWTTPNDKSRVRIYHGENGSFDGKIIWLKQPTYATDYKNKALAGKPKVDEHNPDKSLRSRPVMGMDVLTGFKYSPSDHDWRKGKCYDPDDGKTYTCRMWLKSPDTLMVRGYVWIFHKTQEWHRYTPPAPAMSAAPAATVR